MYVCEYMCVYVHARVCVCMCICECVCVCMAPQRASYFYKSILMWGLYCVYVGRYLSVLSQV